MNQEPDLNFDVDALFDHMGVADGLAVEVSDWRFRVTSPELAKLEQVADEHEEHFEFELQEEVEIFNADDGSFTMGDPMLTFCKCGEFTCQEIKALVAQVQAIATKHDLKYEGVDCYEAIDDDELMGWIPPEDAGWRIRNLTDSGLPENADLPWSFYVETESLETSEEVCVALESHGYSELELFEEPNEEGVFAICLFVEGRNNEAELNIACEKITKVLEPFAATLAGIQFFDREGFAEMFLEE